MLLSGADATDSAGADNTASADTATADADDADSADGSPTQSRRVLGSLQLPIAGIGLSSCLLFLAILASLFGKMPEGNGFIDVLLFGYALAVAGYVLFAVGLAIPPAPGFGIGFRRGQRLLFLSAAVAAVASVVLLLVLLPTALGDNAILYSWLTTAGLAVLGVADGFAGGVASRSCSVETANSRRLIPPVLADPLPHGARRQVG